MFSIASTLHASFATCINLLAMGLVGSAWGADSPPTITIEASATPAAVAGKTSALSVTATDDGGVSALKYTWSATGPSPVTFSANGTNAARTPTVTFRAIGSYQLTVSVIDGAGQTATSAVGVTVSSTPTSMDVMSTGTSILNPGQTKSYTGVVYNQFGVVMTAPAPVAWSIASGSGAINSSSGVYTAALPAGFALVRGTCGTLTNTAQVQVNAAPTVGSAVSTATTTITTATAPFDVQGADDQNIDLLNYTWSATGPAAVSFSPANSLNAEHTVATFSAPGAYTITARIADKQNLFVTSSLAVTIASTPTSMDVMSSGTSILNPGQTKTYNGVVYNQFGTVVQAPASFTWSMASGSGSVSTGGVYTAELPAGLALVRGTCGTLTNTAQVQVNAAPTVANPVTTASTVFSDNSVAFDVLGADDQNVDLLNYTWSATGPSPVAFSPGNSLNAEHTVATFSGVGTYVITAKIADKQSLFITNSLTVTVVPPNQAPVVSVEAKASSQPVLTTQTLLSVTATDDGGPSALTYTWSATGPAPISFNDNGTNAGRSSMATFAASGTYQIAVLITDAAGLSCSSSVELSVSQAPHDFTISLVGDAIINPGSTVGFSLSGKDQFNLDLNPLPAHTWSIASGGGSIAQSGILTAGLPAGNVTIQAVIGGQPIAEKSIRVNAAPTVAEEARVGSHAGFANIPLTVLGADADDGEEELIYSWSLVEENPNVTLGGAVQGTHAARSSLLTVPAAGTYTVSVQISDPHGLTCSSTVDIHVDGQSPSGFIDRVLIPEYVSQTQLPIEVMVHGSPTDFTYAWEVQGAAATVVDAFSRSTQLIIPTAGIYWVRVKVKNQNDEAEYSAWSQVAAPSVPSSIKIIGNGISGQSRHYTPGLYDQFGTFLDTPEQGNWSTVGGGTITPDGVFTPNGSNGEISFSYLGITGAIPAPPTASSVHVSLNEGLTGDIMDSENGAEVYFTKNTEVEGKIEVDFPSQVAVMFLLTSSEIIDVDENGHFRMAVEDEGKMEIAANVQFINESGSTWVTSQAIALYIDRKPPQVFWSLATPYRAIASQPEILAFGKDPEFISNHLYEIQNQIGFKGTIWGKDVLKFNGETALYNKTLSSDPNYSGHFFSLDGPALEMHMSDISGISNTMSLSAAVLDNYNASQVSIGYDSLIDTLNEKSYQISLEQFADYIENGYLLYNPVLDYFGALNAFAADRCGNSISAMQFVFNARRSHGSADNVGVGFWTNGDSTVLVGTSPVRLASVGGPRMLRVEIQAGLSQPQELIHDNSSGWWLLPQPLPFSDTAQSVTVSGLDACGNLVSGHGGLPTTGLAEYFIDDPSAISKGYGPKYASINMALATLPDNGPNYLFGDGTSGTQAKANHFRFELRDLYVASEEYAHAFDGYQWGPSPYPVEVFFDRYQVMQWGLQADFANPRDLSDYLTDYKNAVIGYLGDMYEYADYGMIWDAAAQVQFSVGLGGPSEDFYSRMDLGWPSKPEDALHRGPWIFGSAFSPLYVGFGGPVSYVSVDGGENTSVPTTFEVLHALGGGNIVSKTIEIGSAAGVHQVVLGINRTGTFGLRGLTDIRSGDYYPKNGSRPPPAYEGEFALGGDILGGLATVSNVDFEIKYPIPSSSQIWGNPNLHCAPFRVDGPQGRRLTPGVVTIPPSWTSGPVATAINIRDENFQGSTSPFVMAPFMEFQGPSFVEYYGTKPAINSIELNNGVISSNIALDRWLEGGRYSFAYGLVPSQIQGSLLDATNRGISLLSAYIYGRGRGAYVNSATQWFNSIKLENDVVASGSVATLHLTAGYFDQKNPRSEFNPLGDYVHFVNSENDITVVDESENGIQILTQRMISGQTLEIKIRIGAQVQNGLYSVDVRLGAVRAYADDLSETTAGANGAHRMNKALAVVGVDCVAGHRFGSIHMKKAFRTDNRLSYLDQYVVLFPEEYFKIGKYWFITDKIGPNDPNFAIFETGPVEGGFNYDLSGCTRVGPQMYDQYQYLVDSINYLQNLLYTLGVISDPEHLTTGDLFSFVMSAQGYQLDPQKVIEGRYWQSPAYTQPGEYEITGNILIEGHGCPIKLKIAVDQLTMRVDSNADRKINQDDDLVKGIKPFRFWTNTNNGYDEGVRDDGTNDISSPFDAIDARVNGLRDLIDMAPLSLNMSTNITKQLNENRSRWRIKLVREGTGAVNLFGLKRGLIDNATGEPAKDFSYLTNRSLGNQELDWSRQFGVDEALKLGTALPASFIFSANNWFLFEGLAPGVMKLKVMLVDVEDGDKEYECDSALIELEDINQFYVMLNAETDLITNNPEYMAVGATDERYSAIDPLPGRTMSDISPDAKVLVFVHGFNVDLPAAKRWFDESYKRLYWTGFKDELVGIHWNGADPALVGGPPFKFNTNISHAFQAGSLLATWLPGITSSHEVSLLSHSAGTVVALEALRLMQVTNPGASKVKNLITSESATFENVFSAPLPAIDFNPGTFDNLSHNNWFAPALSMVSGTYENFFSANDHTLWLTMCDGNENLGVGKILGHATDTDARVSLQAVQRNAWRMAFRIPGIHSFGPDEFGVKCVIPHGTSALGSVAVPGVANVNCEATGFGINQDLRNKLAGSHSFMRETNYDETYLMFRRIYEVTK